MRGVGLTDTEPVTVRNELEQLGDDPRSSLCLSQAPFRQCGLVGYSVQSTLSHQC